ncbi:MAG: ATP-binding cassette domain-containing protein, partial [Sphingomonadales bacterium]|nr:ATP-binding cassette domain-containing protein [Sphingomonadales bacterium]MBU3991301.1 ATP-binding cassette domain-containing protein [Alphaproteobacteria bacterium]
MIWRLAANYPRQVLTAFIALLASSSATIAIPMRFKAVIDQAFGPGAKIEAIQTTFELMLLIVLVLGLATATRFYFVSWLGERVVADLREAVQRNLLRLPPSFFEENSPKEISSRMTSDTALIEVVVGTTVSVALRNIITGIGGTIYLFYLAPMLTLQLVVAIPLIIAPIVWFGRRLSKASRTSQDRIADIGALTGEVLGAMRVVQSFNQEAREIERFHGAVDRTFQAARRRIFIRAIMTAAVTMLIFGSITLLLWQGAMSVATGQISGGTIAAFVITGGLVAGAFGALTEVYGDLLRGAGAASRLNELLNEKPAIAPPARPTTLPVPPRGQISFDKVTFRYPSRPEVAALAEVSFAVEPGETVAIVGPSGAGKSTVFQLAQRFYDPQAGMIKIDGVPMTSADPAEIRRRIALVPQEGVLFAASARDNLRYGDWDATDEAIWEAARA